jgi:hypothetical protein
MLRGPRRTIALVTLAMACLAIAAPSGASVHRAGGLTYKGALQFEGLAAVGANKNCHGEGAFGVAKAGARVTVSERNTAGDFTTLGTGKLAKGKVAEFLGDEVCLMKYKVKAASAPAADSRVYVEWKGLTFNISLPASGDAAVNLA